MYRSLGFVCLLVAAIAQAAEVPEMPVAPRPAPGAIVNCNNGESIQAAVDAVDPSIGPVEIRISGICVENVLIRDKDVSLRGAQSPALDGIRSATPATPALVVRGTVLVEINDLSFSNNPGTAVAVRRGAVVQVVNSRFENNVVGLRVDSGSTGQGIGLTFTANSNSDSNTSDAQFFCTACDFNSPGGPAAVSTRGALVSLNDCVVTNGQGIVADQGEAIVDFDCVSVNTPHPCSLTATAEAAISLVGGTARLIGTNFTGQLIADDRSAIRLDGAVQRAGSVNGQPNIVDHLGEIIVSPLVNPPAQSVLLTTVAARFARVLLTGNSVLGGSIQCSGAGDAFLDPTVTRAPGTTVTGCEHGSVTAR